MSPVIKHLALFPNGLGSPTALTCQRSDQFLGGLILRVFGHVRVGGPFASVGRELCTCEAMRSR